MPFSPELTGEQRTGPQRAEQRAGVFAQTAWHELGILQGLEEADVAGVVARAVRGEGERWGMA